MTEPASNSEQAASIARALARCDDETSPFSIQIGQVYDGPFELLLDLIRKQDIDIYDIPIASITQQYLQYVQNLRELEVDIAADFLLMAATLIQIKSKMLLPADPLLPGEAAADPRDELVQKLLEYEQFKKAAGMLHQKQQLEEASWNRPGLLDFAHDEETEAELAVTSFDLVRTFQQVLARAEERPQFEIAAENVTVGEMIEHIRRLLERSDDPIAVAPLLALAPNRSALLATFLALLELVRLRAIRLRQERMYGEIMIRKHPMFATVWEKQAPGASEPDYR